MKIVGYMEGTNSEVLTNLFLEGFETLPLSNGWDNHGKYIAHLNRNDNISVVVGYLHKFIPLAKEFDLGGMLSALKVYKIPVVFIVPEKKQDKANKFLKNKGLKYKLAEPSKATQVVLEYLKPKKAVAKKKVVKKRR